MERRWSMQTYCFVCRKRSKWWENMYNLQHQSMFRTYVHTLNAIFTYLHRFIFISLHHIYYVYVCMFTNNIILIKQYVFQIKGNGSFKATFIHPHSHGNTHDTTLRSLAVAAASIFGSVVYDPLPLPIANLLLTNPLSRNSILTRSIPPLFYLRSATKGNSMFAALCEWECG